MPGRRAARDRYFRLAKDCWSAASAQSPGFVDEIAPFRRQPNAPGRYAVHYRTSKDDAWYGNVADCARKVDEKPKPKKSSKFGAIWVARAVTVTRTYVPTSGNEVLGARPLPALKPA